MSATPAPVLQVWSGEIPDLGNVPLSPADIDYAKWPKTWGEAPPTTDPMPPMDLPIFMAHLGLHLSRRFGAVNQHLLAANQFYARNGFPAPWEPLVRAIEKVNELFVSVEPAIRFPFVKTIKDLEPASDKYLIVAVDSQDQTFSGTLQIHVDAEPLPTGGFGSWRFVTGYELVMNEGDSGGGPSSSSYYASSSSHP